MELLNREAKQGATGLGANITVHAVTRVEKAPGETVPLLEDSNKIVGIQ